MFSLTLIPTIGIRAGFLFQSSVASTHRFISLRFGRALTGVRRSTISRGEPKGLGILRFLIRAHFGLCFCYCQYCASYFVLLCRFFDCDRFYKTGLLQSTLHCGIHYRLVSCRFYLKQATFASSTVNSNG